MPLSCSCRHRPAMLAAAALLAAVSAGCGGDGASPAASEAAASFEAVAAVEPSDGADASSSESTGSARKGYEAAAAAYERVEAPVGGDTAFGKAEIAAVQEAFDKLGDELSSL